MTDEIRSLIDEIDTDGNGNIGKRREEEDIDALISMISSTEYSEFIAACLDHKFYEQESVCRAAFRVFDLDGDGKITM